jgi:hypothetical protein
MNDLTPEQELGAQFGAVLLGGRVSHDPPPPDSPLGRVAAFVAVYGEDALTVEHIRAAQEGLPLLP